ncbi:hypothetical protein BDQ17DRAFT_1441108 [Cyathus striatus]|nr:hypothetical protein BDQ17DRAFT_1441108 [Cyathus striatus]
MERIFHSRAATQSLLTPQLGNLDIQDYEAAMKFLPGAHRYYGTIGTGMGVTLAYAFRRRRWNNLRIGLFVLFGSVVGNGLGQFAHLAAHLNFVQSIQNLTGFEFALSNIRKETGIPFSRGPVILRYSVQNQSDDASAEDASYLPVATQQQKQVSKWDELRAINEHATKRSSWDTLRQQHERNHTGEKPEDHNDCFKMEKDRTTEQAEFDALLDKERNFK